MDVSSPPPLELNTVGYVTYPHRIVVSKDHLPPEGFNSVLEIPCRQEDVVSHCLVHRLVNIVSQVLLPGYFQDIVTVLDFHSDTFSSRGIYLIVDCAVSLLQHRCEVGAPPHVARGEGEEDLEAVDQNIVDFDMNLIKYLIKKSRY